MLAQMQDAHEPGGREVRQRHAAEGVLEERGQAGDPEARPGDVDEPVDDDLVARFVGQHHDVGTLCLHDLRELGKPAQARDLAPDLARSARADSPEEVEARPRAPHLLVEPGRELLGADDEDARSTC